MANVASPAPNGILLVDKPQGVTSHDVVSKTRKLAGTRKVGHAGTLDPMATGLLILGLGVSTRLLTFIVGLTKEYTAIIRLGSSSSTDDAEGELLGFASSDQLRRVTDESIAIGIASLTGEIEQVPSSVSAIKVDGKRAYALVRAGETVELKSRKVTVSEFEVSSITRGVDAEGHEFIDVDVRVVCSSGTYIRALARDLGFKLGVGGHLTALRRTRIGSFHVADAQDLEDPSEPLNLLAPADVTEPADGSTYADVTGNVDLPDIYGNVLLDYVLYRSYSKDSAPLTFIVTLGYFSTDLQLLTMSSQLERRLI